jgi:hypothetical protein
MTSTRRAFVIMSCHLPRRRRRNPPAKREHAHPDGVRRARVAWPDRGGARHRSDRRAGIFLAAPSIPQFTFRNINRLPRDRGRWFESISLHRRVRQEVDQLALTCHPDELKRTGSEWTRRWSKVDSNSRSHVRSKRDAGTISCALARWRWLVRGAFPCPLRSHREFESPLLHRRGRANPTSSAYWFG